MAEPRRITSQQNVSRSIQDRDGISEALLHRQFPFIQSGGKLSDALHLHKRDAPRPPHVPPPQRTDAPPRPFPSQLLADLTKRELQQVVEILHQTLAAASSDDVHRVLERLQLIIPCTSVIGGVAAYDPDGAFKEFRRVLNVSYSNDWLYAYGKNGYASIDPVLHSFSCNELSQSWDQIFSLVHSRKQLEFIEEAKSFGLAHGLTTGIVDHKRRCASFCSFAGGDAIGTARYKELVEYLAPYLHRVLIADQQTAFPQDTKGLSPRERTVLLWMKEGKTNWEISRIVGVSERTVRFHVESIFMKLDTNSRAQAVAVALEQGLLTPA